MMERRRLKNLAEASPKYKYLVEILSNLVRSIDFNKKGSPFLIKDAVPYDL